MYRPLPIMFIASLLAATAAWAEPQGHDSRYPQGGGGRYERGAGPGAGAPSRQQPMPVERGNRGGGDRGPGGYRGNEAFRGNDGARAEGRGPIGQVYQQHNGNTPQNRDPVREPGRQVTVPRGGNLNPRYDGSRYGRGDVAHVRPGNDRPGNDRYRNDRPGFANGADRYDRDHDRNDRYRDQDRDRSRYTGWTRGRDDWRDGHGRSWHHDGDWYRRYHYDHFRYYDNRFYARQRFNIGFYYAPWGYVPRVWFYGDRLPLSYYGYRYLVDDYYNYDLYAPPYGTSWVRVGNDVLLVDLDTGEVLDVIANLFW